MHIYHGGEEGRLWEVFVFGERHERAMKVAVSSLYLSLEESACAALCCYKGESYLGCTLTAREWVTPTCGVN